MARPGRAGEGSVQDETKADGEGTRTRVGEIGSVAASQLLILDAREPTGHRQATGQVCNSGTRD